MRLLIAAGLAGLLAACGSQGASAPGGVSEGEAKALEEAAEMLEERRLPPEALPPEAAEGAVPEEMTGDTAADASQ
jgi:hypothetical protein